MSRILVFMIGISDFLLLVDRYCSSTGAAESTLSKRVFSDGKRIASVRAGSDVGCRRMARAIRWFSENWPEGCEWPEQVSRPDLFQQEAA